MKVNLDDNKKKELLPVFMLKDDEKVYIGIIHEDGHFHSFSQIPLKTFIDE